MDDGTAAAPRPPTTREQHRFSARGRTWFHVLHGRWGLKVDKVILRLTGYSLMTWQFTLSGGVPYHPTMLLTTIGAKSGYLRTVGLPFWPRNGALVVIGSNGGGAVNPGWSANIRANPQCWLRIKRRLVPALGHVAEGEERARIHEWLSAINPALPRYEESAARFGREVPLVVLMPRTATPDSGGTPSSEHPRRSDRHGAVKSGEDHHDDGDDEIGERQCRQFRQGQCPALTVDDAHGPIDVPADVERDGDAEDRPCRRRGQELLDQ